jgi:uncharacterized protein (DUF1684 family)
MDHHAAIEDWHARRIARLTSLDGWLAITGRWEIGDDPVELPIGIARADGDGVRIGETHHDFGASFLVGEQRWEVSRVGGVRVVRVRDLQSPALRAFRGIDRFPVDAKYRVTARVVPDEQGAKHTYASGATVAKDSPGRLEFELDGVTHSLSASWEGKDRLFVLFGDPTNDVTTYGAGRFVYAPYDGGGTVVLDFNQAFNPPCALTEFATCPLVPEGNQLPVEILAGERYPIRGQDLSLADSFPCK